MTAIATAAATVVKPNKVNFKIDLLLTGPGTLIGLKISPYILMTLKTVIVKRDICEPSVLITPRLKQVFPVSHSA